MGELIKNFLSSNTANFVWAFSAFVVFVLIFYRLGVKHILAAVDAREAKIARELKESEDAYAKAKGLQNELDAKMKQAEGRIGAMMAEAQRDADAVKTAMVEKGRMEIEALRNRSLQEIESARNAALLTLRNQIAELTIVVAEKAIRERLDINKQEALVDAALASALSAGKH